MKKSTMGSGLMIQVALSGVIGALLLGTAVSMSAETTATEPPGDAASSGGTTTASNLTIEEIVVTARKRDEKLQDVPIAITALSGRDLQERQVDRVTDLVSEVPNMVSDGGGSILGAIGLRGVVSETRNLGFDSGLGVYVDGVLTVRPTEANQELPDVADVEVLRGPQGTLFGRNTTAGAVNVITRRASDEFTGDFKLEGGNLGTANFDTFVSGPIIPGTLDAKISAYSDTRSGYVYNSTLNTYNDDVHHHGVRGGFLWTPTSDIEIQLDAYYHNQRDNQLYGQLENNTTGTFAGEPGIVIQPYLVQQNQPSYQDVESSGTYLRANWKLPGEFALTSISAFGRMNDQFQDDDDARPIDSSYSHFVDESKQFTQELRIASPVRGAFDYLAGVYYLHQTSESNRFTEVNGGYIGYITDVSSLTTDSEAAFISGNYRPAESIEISGGVRYTTETKRVDFNQNDTSIVGLPTLHAILSNTDSDPTGNLSFTYKIAADFRAYASVSRGFKSGGFNADIVGDTEIAFGPEHVWAYEVGFKSEPFGGAANINLAIFDSDFSGLQVSQLVGNAFQIKNAATSNIRGAELEIVARPTRDLNVNFGLGYVDAKFGEFENCAAEISCAGKYLPFVPKLTLSAGAEYAQHLTDSTDLRYRIDASYRSSTFADPQNSAPGHLSGYNPVNARFAYEFANGRYSVGLWVKNLLDERYQINAFFLAPNDEWKVTWAEPRTYGAAVTGHF
jgi:iron complex outermembrane receptor protein